MKQNSKAWGRPHAGQDRDKSHQHTRREVTCDSDSARDSMTSQQCWTNLGPRSGACVSAHESTGCIT